MTVGDLLAQPERLFAFAYALATAVVVLFQLGLAAGKAWGDYAMGGRYPGRFPPAMRVAALVQAVLLAALAALVLDTAGLLDLGWSSVTPWIGWVPVVVSAISLLMNALSPSEPERRTWVPVAIVLLGSSLAVVLLTA